MKFKSGLFVFYIFFISVCLNAAVIGMRIPQTTALVGDVVLVPVFADSSLTDKEIYSYQLQIGFDEEIISVDEIVVAEAIGEQFGFPFVNYSVHGQVTIAAAGTIPLTGIGEFLYIQFEILQDGSSPIFFTGEENNYFNEGTPQMQFENGSISNPVSVTGFEPNLSDFVLFQNFPNPFKNSTTISYKINNKSLEKTELIIYNMKGQMVKKYPIPQIRRTSTQQTIWDGTNEQNIPVSSGIYFYRMKSPNDNVITNEMKKLILLK